MENLWLASQSGPTWADRYRARTAAEKRAALFALRYLTAVTDSLGSLTELANLAAAAWRKAPDKDEVDIRAALARHLRGRLNDKALQDKAKPLFEALFSTGRGATNSILATLKLKPVDFSSGGLVKEKLTKAVPLDLGSYSTMDKVYASMYPDLVGQTGGYVANAAGTQADHVANMLVAATNPSHPLPIPQVVKQLREELPDITRKRAVMIARTETARAYGATATEQMRRNGIDSRRVLTAAGSPAASISPVCDTCREAASQGFVKMDSPFGEGYEWSGEYPPFHPHCRCDVGANTKGWMPSMSPADFIPGVGPVEEVPLMVPGEELVPGIAEVPAEVSAPAAAPKVDPWLQQMADIKPFITGQDVGTVNMEQVNIELDYKFKDVPKFKQLKQAVKAWSRSDRATADIRGAADELLRGDTTAAGARGVSRKYAESMLDSMKTAPKIDVPLYRGMTMKGIVNDMLAKYTVGETIDIPLASASGSSAISDLYSVPILAHDIGVKYIIEQGSAGMAIAPLSEFPLETEVVIGGRYQIVSAVRDSHVGGRINVTLRWVDSLGEKVAVAPKPASMISGEQVVTPRWATDMVTDDRVLGGKLSFGDQADIMSDLLKKYPDDKLLSDYATAAENWSKGASVSKDIRFAADDILKGVEVRTAPTWTEPATHSAQNVADAKAMLEVTRNAPPSPQPLYRGIMVDTPTMGGESLQKWATKFAPGKEVDVPLSGASGNPIVANSFASQPKGNGIVFTFQSGTRATPMSPFSAIPQEDEWLLGGRFKVVSSKIRSGVNPVTGGRQQQLLVTLEYQGPLKVAEVAEQVAAPKAVPPAAERIPITGVEKGQEKLIRKALASVREEDVKSINYIQAFPKTKAGEGIYHPGGNIIELRGTGAGNANVIRHEVGHAAWHNSLTVAQKGEWIEASKILRIDMQHITNPAEKRNLWYIIDRAESHTVDRELFANELFAELYSWYYRGPKWRGLIAKYFPQRAKALESILGV